MKLTFTLGLILLFLSPSISQTTKELFSDCGHSQVFDYFFDTTTPDKQSLHFLQDTVRHGDNVLEFELIISGDYEPRALREYLRIDGQKVYVQNRWYDPADPTEEKERLFYDFAPEVGEKVTVPHIIQPGFLFNYNEYTVIEKSTIQLMDGIDRIRMLLELDVAPELTIEWIEGIGNTKGGLLRPAWRDANALLGCVRNSNGTIWIEDNFTEEECTDRLNLQITASVPCESTVSTPIIIEQDINIFPNPTTDHLVIEKESIDPIKLVISDMLGNQVHTDVISSKSIQIDCTTLNYGFYLIQLFDKQGILQHTEKLILNK